MVSALSAARLPGPSSAALPLRVIEVRSDCLPDGGVLHNFADITKRCEAERHIARLAAEATTIITRIMKIQTSNLTWMSGSWTASMMNEMSATPVTP